jgi:tetratricopeptide (TPR) repeat protein
LRNCVALGQWNAVAALAQRILRVEPEDAAARAALGQAQEAIARGPTVGRNEPCPCGSGKRYKHCHGAPGAPKLASATATAAAPTPDVLVARAIEAHKRGQLDAAEKDYRAALETAPEHAYALHFLGVILYQRERFAEALPLLDRAAAQIPTEPEFHNNLGLALAAADRTDEAVAAYRRALALKPDHVVAWSNLGLALQAANRLPEAIVAIRSALGYAPEFAQAHWNLGLALLAHGEFAEGWREYDWRLAIAELGGRIPPPAAPRWNGTDPAGKTLLLTSEQGFGDTLQFVRFAPLLAARGARVLVQTQPALMKLLASAPGVSGVVSNEDQAPACDAHLPLLSLGGALGIDAASIPDHVPYLAADPAEAAAIESVWAPYRGTLNVGLSWAGRRAHGNDRRRSCPLDVLAPLLELPGVTWFSLQRDDGEDQIASVPGARNMVQLEARRNFDGKAALIDALDLVISVDTSNAHLAGALAQPLWVLLPFAPDWRWQLERADNPWYPTARLFRQKEPGGWRGVVDEIRHALASEMAKRR